MILELLDWKKFYVRQIVYFPNGHCRRRCGFRDGTFRYRLASNRVQPKTYRHRGEPGVTHMTARLIEVLLPVRNWGRELWSGKPGRCVSYFTLRIIVILMETIKDLYYQPACPFSLRVSHFYPRSASRRRADMRQPREASSPVRRMMVRSVWTLP